MFRHLFFMFLIRYIIHTFLNSFIRDMLLIKIMHINYNTQLYRYICFWLMLLLKTYEFAFTFRVNVQTREEIYTHAENVKAGGDVSCEKR